MRSVLCVNSIFYKRKRREPARIVCLNRRDRTQDVLSAVSPPGFSRGVTSGDFRHRKRCSTRPTSRFSAQTLPRRGSSGSVERAEPNPRRSRRTMRNMSLPNGAAASPDIDLEIIQEYLEEKSAAPGLQTLPGPPPPPRELDSPPATRSHNPVLVPRGTPPQPQERPAFKPPAAGVAMRGSRAGASRRGRGGPAAPPTRPAAPGTEMLERLLERPQLVVVEQPKERGMRFRYECEGRSAGSILGAGSTEANKTIPSIELQGPMDKIAKVTVTVSLVTKDIPHRPHPHCLVGKDCSEGICIVTINPHTSRQHSFSNLGIQCVRRKELDASLAKRRSQNIDPFNTGQLRSIEDMDMNVVRLCFQCELERLDGETVLLGPVVSNPIYDKKATTTSELKINRLNVVRGTCTGKTEIYMLCDKVQKDDIEIIFSHGGWEAKAEFAQTDVHRQIAIVFKSPPFQEQDLEDEVEVNVFLRRLSDHMDSEPVKFTYLPNNQDPYEVNRKRKIKSDGRFRDECSAAGPGMMADAPAFQPFLQLPLPGDNSAAAMATAAPEDLLQPGENFPDIPYDDHSILMNLVHFLEGMVTPSVPSSAFPVDDPNMNLLSDDLQMTPAFYNDLQFSQMVINSQQQFDAGAAQPEDVGTSPVKVENDAPRRDAAP